MGLTRTLSVQGDFENHPEGGPYSAVCVDMQYMGYVKTAFGEKQKIRYIWLTTELMTSGKPFWVSGMYNLTLSAAKGKESSLYKLLSGWLGKAPVTEKSPAFDFASMIGKPCLLTIVHDTNGDKTYANVSNVTPLMKGMAPITAGSYERRYDEDGLPLDPDKRRAFLAAQGPDAFPATQPSEPSDADDSALDGMTLDEIADTIPWE